jgi:hypothetical protein
MIKVSVFAYNRPDHLRNLLKSFLLNPEAKNLDIRFYVDGPKSDSDQLNINMVKNVINSFTELKNKEIKFNLKNVGLANSIINGVTETFQTCDYQIILEDDLVLHKDFLNFAKLVNEKFKYNPQIAGSNGYAYGGNTNFNENFFIKGADCWGWTTWKDRWESINWNSIELYSQLQKGNQLNEFDLGGKYNYSRILKDQIDGKVDSWAIRWHASMFLQNRYSVYPNISLVANKGFDGSGTHGITNVYKEDLSTLTFNQNLCEFNEQDLIGAQIIEEFYGNFKKNQFLKYLRKILKLTGINKWQKNESKIETMEG